MHQLLARQFNFKCEPFSIKWTHKMIMTLSIHFVPFVKCSDLIFFSPDTNLKRADFVYLFAFVFILAGERTKWYGVFIVNPKTEWLAIPSRLYVFFLSLHSHSENIFIDFVESGKKPYHRVKLFIPSIWSAINFYALHFSFSHNPHFILILHR